MWKGKTELITSRTPIDFSYDIPYEGEIFEGASLGVLKSQNARIARLDLQADVLRQIGGMIESFRSGKKHAVRIGEWLPPKGLIQLTNDFEGVIIPQFSKYFEPKNKDCKLIRTSNREFAGFHIDNYCDANIVIHKPVSTEAEPKLRQIITAVSQKSKKAILKRENRSDYSAVGLYPNEALIFGKIAHAPINPQDADLMRTNRDDFSEDSTAYLADLYLEEPFVMPPQLGLY